MTKPTSTPDPVQLLACIRNNRWDQALSLGLMDYAPSANVTEADPMDPACLEQIVALQQRFRRTWAARDRYNAHVSRQLRQQQSARASSTVAENSAAADQALPPLASALLAKATAKARQPS